jgi:hypothetical protein
MLNDDNPNGTTPKLKMPEELHFERGPLYCWSCKQEFKHFTLETIDKITQLRVGDVLIANVRMACLHCGRVFVWDINTNKLDAMAVEYGKLSSKLPGYNPE